LFPRKPISATRSPTLQTITLDLAATEGTAPSRNRASQPHPYENAYPTQQNYECASSRLFHALHGMVLQPRGRTGRLYGLYTFALCDLYAFLDVIECQPETKEKILLDGP
jgi:hypothetical protein